MLNCAICCLTAIVLSQCSQQKKKTTLFTSIEPDESGINFSNELPFDKDFNIYTYRNYYNGGGVALGDINNDGLIDIYFTGNITPNKLFLNKGNFKFEDITARANVEGKGAWSTGVSMADINGDGYIDIYVCNSGDIKGDNKQNELFINNGDLTFTERAEEYGIADRGYTTHAAFFDYDKDGDLDLYILNNSYQAIGSFNLRKNERPKRDSLGGHKFFRNDDGKFKDVSEEVGVYGSVIGFGLGVTVGDMNKDGWPDIYVSNDFFERDYLYLNTGKGVFKECLTEEIKSISGASMGADVADINNDCYPDIFVTEMLPADNARLKTVTTFENWDRYQFNVQNDYYHQFTRNMLQLNNGDGSFSEIGRLSGVEATDWSWGALIFDMDNDGLKDIFVSNGIYRDLTNQDYLQYVSDPEIVRTVISGNRVDYKRLIELIPSTPVPDYAFQNQGNLSFKNQALEWGLGDPNFSNGAAYGDLDNDGDLDLVVSHVNSHASVFRNEGNKLLPKNRFLKFELKGIQSNTFAFGTKVTVTEGNRTFYLEQMPIRGFESSMDPRPNIGLGEIDTVDQILIEWPDGKSNLLTSVPTNQTIRLDQKDGILSDTHDAKKAERTGQVFEIKNDVIDFAHKENDFVDFDRDHLIYHMISTEGPRMSTGDINGDGLTDVYIGGAKDQLGALFVQQRSGKFQRENQSVFEADKGSEDMGSVFFDADNDGDLDLYVCSGGSEFSNTSVALIDRLYFNNGHGKLTKSRQTLPTAKFESTSTVKANDYDGDGDQDLFVGVRFIPSLYGAPANGYILNNDGKGNFKEVSRSIAPGLQGVGMITDAVWSDINKDGRSDLLIVGEYMPLTVFINENGKFVNKTEQYGLSKTNGWWNRIKSADLDHDGDVDFVLGNHGLNSRFRASLEHPVSMYVSDFDQNGTVEQIVSLYNGDKSYPMVLRHDLVMQLPYLKKKYLKYETYKDQAIQDIFSVDELKNSLTLQAYQLSSCVLMNEGPGKLTVKPLPTEAQFSPVYGIEVFDYNNDGNQDVLLGGNLYRVKPEAGRYDASYSTVLLGQGNGNFQVLSSKDSHVRIDGEIRDIVSVDTAEGSLLIVSRNNEAVIVLKKNGK